MDHFRSADAKQSNSLTRVFVESAVDYFACLTEDSPAKVLFAAITLGGSTLSKFLTSLENLEAKHKRETSFKLS